MELAERGDLESTGLDPFLLFLRPDHPVTSIVESQNIGAVVRPDYSSAAFASIHQRGDIPNHYFHAILHTPSADPREVLARQEIVQVIVEHKDVRKDVESKTASVEQFNNYLGYLSDIPKSEQDAAYSINRDRSYKLETDPDYYIPKTNLEIFAADELGKTETHETVRKILESINQLLEAVKLWAKDDLVKIPHDFFLSVSQTVVAHAGAIPFIDTERLVSQAKNQERIYQSELARKAKTLVEDAQKVAALLAFGNIIENENMQKVQFVEADEAGFLDGWNIYKVRSNRKAAQVQNNGLPATQLRVIAGANMTGKSFTLEREFSHQEFAQSVGYAPSNEPRVSLTPSLLFVDRSSTLSLKDLSAFGSEVAAWSKVLAVLTAKGKLFADEAFSTTGPDEQEALLQATAAFIKALGAQATLATHNERAIEQFLSDPDCSVMHLGFSVHESGVVYTHMLEEGADDSFALDVAQSLQFPPHVQAYAHGYLNGELAPLQKEVTHSQEVNLLPEQEREALKLTIGNPSLFMRGVDYAELKPATDMFRYRYLVGESDKIYTLELLSDRYRSEWESDRRERILKWENIFEQKADVGGGFNEAHREMFDIFGDFGLQMLYAPTAEPATILELQRFYEAFSNIEFSIDLQESIIDAQVTLHALCILMTEWKAPERVQENIIKAMQDFYSLYSAHDPSLCIEVAEFLLAMHQRTAKDLGISKHLKVLYKLRDYCIEEAKLEESKNGLRDSGEHSRIVDELDALRASWKEKLVKIEKAYTGKVESYEYDMPDGTIVTHYFTNPEKIVENAIKAISKKLKKLPSLNVLGSDFMPDHPTGHTRLELLHALQQKMPQLVRNEEGNYRYMGFTVHAYITQLGLVEDTRVLGEEVVKKLKSIDSVAAHQYGNYLEAIFATALVGATSPSEALTRIITNADDSRAWHLKEDSLHYRNAQIIGLELQRCKTLVTFARQLQAQGFVPVAFTNDAHISLRQGWNPLKPSHKQVKNDLEIGQDEQLLLFTGANMSGKTNGLKQLHYSLIFANHTGMVPAASAVMPFVHHTHFVERPDASRQSKGLSAFGTDVLQWTKLFSSIAKNELTAVFVDEAFSSTSPKYQEALTYASVVELSKMGVLGAIATHSHAVVDALEQAHPEVVSAVHYKTNITEDGTAAFTYQVKKGHDQSKAIEVARALGGIPIEILDEADRILLAKRTA